jgi:hypothetical protein
MELPTTGMEERRDMRSFKKKRIGILIAALIVIWLIIFNIDYSRAQQLQKPVFMIETISKETTSVGKRYFGVGYWIDADRYSADSDQINNVEFYLFGIQLLHLFG